LLIILLLLLRLCQKKPSAAQSPHIIPDVDFCTTAEYTDTSFNKILRYAFQCSTPECEGTFNGDPLVLHPIRAFALKEGYQTYRPPLPNDIADFYINLYQNCSNGPLCLTRIFPDPANNVSFSVASQTMVQETINESELGVEVKTLVVKGKCGA